MKKFLLLITTSGAQMMNVDPNTPLILEADNKCSEELNAYVKAKAPEK